jgi:hypothetical protein
MVEEGFATKDLKDIFSLVENVDSDTYDLLSNRREKNSDDQQRVADAMQGWSYTKDLDDLPVYIFLFVTHAKDPLLKKVGKGEITMVFSKSSAPAQQDNEYEGIENDEDFQ